MTDGTAGFAFAMAYLLKFPKSAFIGQPSHFLMR